MSIINDALKKAQKNMQNNPNTNEKNTPQNQQESGTPEPKSDFIKENLRHLDKEKKKQSLEEKNQDSSSQSEPSNQQKTEIVPPSKKEEKKTVSYSSKPSKLPLLVFLLVCLAGVIYFYYLRPGRGTLTKKSIRTVTRNLPKIPSFKKTTSTSTRRAVQRTRRKTVPRGSMELNGIVMMGERRVALINNDIYEVGDSVDGKKIINITTNDVELKDGEKTITLKVQK